MRSTLPVALTFFLTIFASEAFAQYCIPTADSCEFYIESVNSQASGLTFADNGCTAAYQNYTSAKGTINAGTALDLQIIPNFVGLSLSVNPGTVEAYRIFAFIDLNENNVFDTLETFEMLGQTLSNNRIFAGSIPIPANTTSGLKRLRIRTAFMTAQNQISPCSHQSSGEAEDYTIIVTNPAFPPPACVDETTTSPRHNTTNRCTAQTLSWGPVTDATSYKVTLFDMPTGTRIFNDSSVTGTSIKVPVPLQAATVYSWIAVPVNDNGSALGCDTLRFTTAANPDPIANIQPSADTVFVCDQASEMLDGSPSQGTGSYTHSWNEVGAPGTNTLLSDTAVQAPVFSGGPGTYKYRYFVQDANGCRGYDTVNVKVTPVPDPGTLSSTHAEVCAGGTTRLHIVPSSGAFLTWEDSIPSGAAWFPTGDVVYMAGDSFSLPALTEDHYYRATAYFSTGCSSRSNMHLVGVNPLPVVPTIVVDDNPVNCEGETVSLTISTPDNVVWNDAANTTGPFLSVTTSGSYRATLTNADGCTAQTAFETVTFKPLPAVTSVSVIGGPSFCEGDSATLMISTSDNVTWNDPNTTNANSIIVRDGGTYQATITTPDGCSAFSDAVNITENPIPAKPVISPSGAVTGCAGQAVVLSSSENTGNQWSDPAGSTTGQLSVTDAGSYYVTYTDPNGCSAVSDPVAVTFEDLPATPVITQNGDSMVAGGGVTYKWLDENGVVSGEGDTYFAPGVRGYYRVIAVSANDCESDTSEAFLFSGVGIGEKGMKSFSLYPNPSNGSVTLDLSAFNAPVNIQVTDISGRVVSELILSPRIHHIELQLKAGVYWLQTSTGQGTYSSRLQILK